MRRALILVAIVLSACGKKPAPPPAPDPRPANDDACTTAEDCAITSYNDETTCCEECGRGFVNKTAKAQVEAYCAAHPGARCARKPADCPDFASSTKFACKDGHCREYVPPPPPPVGGTCNKDEDCDLTLIGEDCCFHCAQRIGSKTAIRELQTKCARDRDAGRVHCEGGVLCSTHVGAPGCNLNTHQCQ